MTIDELIQKKPHLNETLQLYMRIIAFREEAAKSINASLKPGDISYPAAIVDEVIASFATHFGLPAETLTPLKEAMKSGQIDFTRLPLNEVPSFALPYHEDELLMILFLIAKPFFTWLKSSSTSEKKFWENGKCAVCSAVPSLAFIKKEEGKTLHCSFCESTGSWHRVGCPNCGNRDAGKIELIEAEGEHGIRVELCTVCRSYIKSAEDSLLNKFTPELVDIMSLPLDLVAQERGYARISPNPLGMKKIA